MMRNAYLQNPLSHVISRNGRFVPGLLSFTQLQNEDQSENLESMTSAPPQNENEIPATDWSALAQRIRKALNETKK